MRDFCNCSHVRILIKMHSIAPNFVNPTSKSGSFSLLLVRLLAGLDCLGHPPCDLYEATYHSLATNSIKQGTTLLAVSCWECLVLHLLPCFWGVSQTTWCKTTFPFFQFSLCLLQSVCLLHYLKSNLRRTFCNPRIEGEASHPLTRLSWDIPSGFC